MESKVEIITPYVAEQFLAQSAPNRPRRKSRIDQYAESIKRGEWRMNGETIKFDADGKMIDGQHRCLAVMKTGKSIRVLVARGVESGSFATIDSGAKRTGGDVLALSGEVSYNQLAAVLKFIFNIEENNGQQERQATAQQLQATLARHPTARDWVRRLQRMVNKKIGGALPACATLCLIEEIAGDPVVDFFEHLATGENLSGSSPILLLRNRMISDPVFKTGSSTARRTVSDLVIRAWNCHARGEKIQKLMTNKADHIGNICVPKGE